MKEYQKINTLYKFDGITKKYTNEITTPEIDYLKDLSWLASEKVDGCVSSRTRMIMADGTSKYIKDIKEGDLVWGYDIEAKQAKIVSVQATSRKSRAGKWFIIKTKRNSLNKGNYFGIIHCTDDHKIYTTNRGYIEAKDLVLTDKILNIRQDRDWPSYLPKESPNQYHPLILEEEIISIEADPKTRERYDIQTETHNFFTQGGLVHNCNIRVEYDGYRVSWSGRTDKSQLPKEVEELLQKTFGESEVVFEQNFGNKEVMLFMECYGGKIQGGLYGGSERLIGFDVMINGMYLDKRVIKDIFNYFGVETVEFFEVESLTRLIDKAKDNIKMGIKDMSKYATEDKPTEKEGFVCVPNVRLLDAQGKRIIVKVKYRDLAKCKE